MATWTDPTGAASTIYSVDGDSGVMTLDNVNNEGTQLLVGVDVEECEISFTMDWVTGGAGTITPGAYYRAAVDLSTYFKVVFTVDLDFLTQDTITGITISSESGTIGTATVSKAHTIGVPFRVKIRSTQNHFVKVWSANTTEPLDWDLSAGSGSTASGTVGLTAGAVLDAPVPGAVTPIWMYGAEQATINGINGLNAFVATTISNLAISSAGQGHDGIGYALVASGGIGGWTTPTHSWGSPSQLTGVFYINYGTLPGADQDHMYILGAGVDPKIMFRDSDDRLVFVAPAGSGGTDGVSINPITSGVWYRIDFSYGGNVSPIVCQWSINGVAQPSMSYPTTVPRTATNLQFQAPANTRWDDLVVTASTSDYPIGNERIIALTPEATITEVGTANALARFTNNGGGLDTTFNAADILAAVSEFPPAIGASSSGVRQRTSGAGNYIMIPLENYSLAAGEGVGAVAVEVLGWASSTTGNEIVIGGYDGSSETTLFTGDPNFDNSTTTMVWITRIYTPSGNWNGTKLNAAQITLGKSTNLAALPGAHFLMAEAMIRTEDDAGASTIDIEFDGFTCLACEED